MKNKFLLLISILFLVLSTYSFSDMSFEEKEKFTKQLSNAIEKKDKQTIKTLTKKYINEYPNEDYPYEYLGTIYAAEENYKEAEKYLLKAIELGNKDTAIISLAFVYLDQEKDKKADEILKKVDEKLLNNPMTILEIIRREKTLAVFFDVFNAQWYLADFYKTHLNDDKEAKKWAQKALNSSRKIPVSELDSDKLDELLDILEF